MSLDVYLESEDTFTPVAHGSGIFIRHEGQTLEITRDQWDFLNPGREPVLLQSPEETTVLFRANITHNLGRMAAEAGIYEVLWRPDEAGISHAAHLVAPLRAGYRRLIAEPGRWMQFNPSNGWGSYEGLVAFVNRYLAACEQWGEGKVRVSR